MSECPATFEAVEEIVVAGDTGCPICGGQPEEHEREDLTVLGYCPHGVNLDRRWGGSFSTSWKVKS